MAKNKTTEMYAPSYRIRRNYKDGLFRLLFSDKQEALGLYNALNGSAYTNPDLLEITTMEDVIYMGVKNDMSFLVEVEKELDLFEAQGSWCPNMPLRGLFYFSGMYQGYIASRGLDIYSRKRIVLPRPVYMVFYNGPEKVPEQATLRLSDSFAAGGKGQKREAAVEVVAKVWNINYGHNKSLMENCRQLHDYAWLIERIRGYQKDGVPRAEAVNRAVDDGIEQGILREFLLKHRGEVCNVILTEYDEELHIRSEKQLSFEEGEARGMERGMKKGMERGREEGIRAFIEDNLEESVTRERLLEKLQRRFALSAVQAKEYLERFAPGC